MGFADYLTVRHLNLYIFIIMSFSATGWWQGFLDPKTAGAISGALGWAASVMNFATNGPSVPVPGAPKV